MYNLRRMVKVVESVFKLGEKVKFREKVKFKGRVRRSMLVVQPALDRSGSILIQIPGLCYSFSLKCYIQECQVCLAVISAIYQSLIQTVSRTRSSSMIPVPNTLLPWYKTTF